MLAPLPVSQATNAYDFCQEIVDAVRQEPKRLDMDNWVTVYRYEHSSREDLPACGTVCCLGGWAVALKGSAYDVDMANGTNAMRIILNTRDVYGNYANTAMVNALSRCFSNFPDTNRFQRGTSEYVEEALVYFLRFMEEWKSELQAIVY